MTEQMECSSRGVTNARQLRLNMDSVMSSAATVATGYGRNNFAGKVRLREIKQKQRFSFRRIPSRRTRALPTSLIGTGMQGFRTLSSAPVHVLFASVGASALVKGAQALPGQKGSAMAQRTLGQSKLTCAVMCCAFLADFLVFQTN